MTSGLLKGALAGAAGTTALNAATYGDMVLRARPASSVPEHAVDDLAKRAGHPVPGRGEDRDNRLSGLGALSGIAVGVGTGAALGALRRAGLRLPLWLGGAAAGVLAMAATDLPMARLGVTSDPRSWSAPDWVSDLVPHLVYGYVTGAALEAMDPGGP
ncbi:MULTISPECIES: hypothetical protein [Streptomyces]|uniref:hypothetical protein n=1 Tax=Streptomyces TaxID=1883 RepID=UPI001D154D9D|nr:MULTISPECIES: hypothetical protein [Streptomyces]MCC3655629.1 hypothetical protein [Streptomyces sp. S07_1.15]WSQ70058.1 hypothetical protein OG463_00540 [Streptomyces xinghaiensis]